ncbi:MAG TPA: PilZ domain-containing protein [Candidatus Methylomirabilis sp.]|nr:PilZ domain-containing protein [Candidatus Methylomirabilis sp.]
MAPERRRTDQPRLQVRVPVVMQPVGSAEGPGFGETEDLSAGGMRLRLAKPTAPGAVVRVSLRPHQSLAWGVVGRVVWTKPHADSTGWALGIVFEEDLTDRVVLEIFNPEVPSPDAGSPQIC